MIARIVSVFAIAALCLSLPVRSAAPQLRQKKTISLAGAKKMAAAVETEALKEKVAISIAICDDGGNLIFLERMDGAHPGTMEVTEKKARAAAAFNTTTKFFEDSIAKGGNGTSFLSLPDVPTLAGGVPVRVDGEGIGGIAVGGAMDDIDEALAQLGVAALTK